jgi:hypothetical protein
MSKRFDFDDDMFIHAYYDAIGSYIGPHDLGRSAASINARVRKLKATGAWDALTDMANARRRYQAALGLPLADWEEVPS